MYGSTKFVKILPHFWNIRLIENSSKIEFKNAIPREISRKSKNFTLRKIIKCLHTKEKVNTQSFPTNLFESKNQV